MDPVRSEQGVALIIVLLLLAVMAGLTTGLTLNGQTEIAMATNEAYYAGARGAAEAEAFGDVVVDIQVQFISIRIVPIITSHRI